MKVRIKRLDKKNSVLPSYAKPGDNGLDLVAISKTFDGANNVYGTGLAIEIPPHYVGFLFPRSSNSKKDEYLTNHVGVLDSSYRGEIMFKYRNLVSYIPAKDQMDFIPLGEYDVGDRIGQLVIVPCPEIELEEVDEISETERGSGGYGHTGN